MKSLTENFLHHLLSIGLLSPETITDFIQINSNYTTDLPNHSKTEIKDCFKETMTMSLTHFIFSLDSKRKRLLMLNIILQYIQQSKRLARNKLRTVIVFLSNSKHYNASRSSYPLNLNKAFHQWSIKSKHIIPSSHSPNEFNNNTSVCPQETECYYDKLYNDQRVSSKKKEMLTLEADTIEAKRNSFTPNIILNRKHIHNHSYNNYTRTHTYDSSPLPNANPDNNARVFFHARQRSFLEMKEKHKKDRITSIDTAISNECTFLPSINPTSHSQSRSRSLSPAHLRLYDDFHLRRRHFITKQQELNMKIKQESNHNKTISIDYRRIQFLYNEYKTKKCNKTVLESTTDKETGVTYQPLVHHDKYYQRVNTSFFEREKEHISNKKTLHQANEEAFLINQKESQVGYQKLKSMPSFNKKNISLHVVERLCPKYNNPHHNKERHHKTNYISTSTCAYSRNGLSMNTSTINPKDYK